MPSLSLTPAPSLRIAPPPSFLFLSPCRPFNHPAFTLPHIQILTHPLTFPLACSFLPSLTLVPPSLPLPIPSDPTARYHHQQRLPDHPQTTSILRPLNKGRALHATGCPLPSSSLCLLLLPRCFHYQHQHSPCAPLAMPPHICPIPPACSPPPSLSYSPAGFRSPAQMDTS